MVDDKYIVKKYDSLLDCRQLAAEKENFAIKVVWDIFRAFSIHECNPFKFSLFRHAFDFVLVWIVKPPFSLVFSIVIVSIVYVAFFLKVKKLRAVCNLIFCNYMWQENFSGPFIILSAVILHHKWLSKTEAELRYLSCLSSVMPMHHCCGTICCGKIQNFPWNSLRQALAP